MCSREKPASGDQRIAILLCDLADKCNVLDSATCRIFDENGISEGISPLLEHARSVPCSVGVLDVGFNLLQELKVG